MSAGPQLPVGDHTTWSTELDVDVLGHWIGRVSSGDEPRGAILEQFMVWLLPHIPGFRVEATNTFSFGRASEVDVTLWNEQSFDDGFRAYGPTIVVECKNWSTAVGAPEIAWFDWKMRLGGVEFGLFVATSGITGSVAEKSAAWRIVAHARGDGRTIVILTLDELAQLTSTTDLRRLVIAKLCDVTAGASQTLNEQAG